MGSRMEPAATAHHRVRKTAEMDEQVLDRADLIALTGDLAGQRFTVHKRLVIGRASGLDICLSDSEVSRHHAAIGRSSEAEFVVEDLGSRNGTLVNGVPVKVHVLKFGDKVQVGRRTLFVFAPHSSLEEQLIGWQRIEMFGQLAAGVVHDFSNYITAVLGQVEYLRKRLHGPGLDENVLERSLDKIHLAATQGFRLTRKVLDCARSSEPHWRPVDLATVIDDALQLTARASDCGIELSCQVEGTLSISGDRTELLQVLINLLLNARDAMPDGVVLTI
jgi:signal transduction histidine kinase